MRVALNEQAARPIQAPPAGLESQIEQIIRALPGDQQEEFRKLVNTGEASADFLERLDRDTSLQAAADAVFVAAHNEFASMAATLGEQRPVVPSAPKPGLGKRIRQALGV